MTLGLIKSNIFIDYGDWLIDSLTLNDNGNCPSKKTKNSVGAVSYLIGR